MISLQTPADDNGVAYADAELYDICINGEKNLPLKKKLQRIRKDIKISDNAYNLAATISALHSVSRTQKYGKVTKQDLTSIYIKMRDEAGNDARVIYDRIRSAPALQLCPLCGLGTIKTLDHHLPKTHYPALSVTPNNLVPACYDCQVFKGQKYPKTEGTQTLHPYFDNTETDIWLRASVEEIKPAAFRYFVDTSASYDAVMIARLERHMEVFHLTERFSIEAARELGPNRQRLAHLLEKGSSADVRQALQDSADSSEAEYINSWRTAMYQAATESDWFCEGGFLQT